MSTEISADMKAKLDELIHNLGEVVTVAAKKTLAVQPVGVLQALDAAINYDGVNEVLAVVTEAIPGMLPDLIMKGMIAKRIREADYRITIDDIDFLSNWLSLRADDQRYGFKLFCVQANYGRFLIATDGHAMIASKSTLPLGVYLTDGVLATFAGEDDTDGTMKSIAQYLTKPSMPWEGDRGVWWCDQHDRSFFTVECKGRLATASGETADLFLEVIDPANYELITLDDNREALVFSDINGGRIVSVAPYVVTVPDWVRERLEGGDE